MSSQIRNTRKRRRGSCNPLSLIGCSARLVAHILGEPNRPAISNKSPPRYMPPTKRTPSNSSLARSNSSPSDNRYASRNNNIQKHPKKRTRSHNR